LVIPPNSPHRLTLSFGFHPSVRNHFSRRHFFVALAKRAADPGRWPADGNAFAWSTPSTQIKSRHPDKKKTILLADYGRFSRFAWG
jgi:hypothetical protein